MRRCAQHTGAIGADQRIERTAARSGEGQRLFFDPHRLPGHDHPPGLDRHRQRRWGGQQIDHLAQVNPQRIAAVQEMRGGVRLISAWHQPSPLDDKIQTLETLFTEGMGAIASNDVVAMLRAHERIKLELRR